MIGLAGLRHPAVPMCSNASAWPDMTRGFIQGWFGGLTGRCHERVCVRHGNPDWLDGQALVIYMAGEGIYAGRGVRPRLARDGGGRIWLMARLEVYAHSMFN